ncbi:MAG: homoserine kinase [Chloroflexi bacterium]|nr:homoserine kinase [Chloroflexota bacterium]
MPPTTSWRVPATTANLGPGFDCLGMALTLYNDVSFSLEGEGVRVEIHGEGADTLPGDESNLIVKSFLHVYQAANTPPPNGLFVTSRNRIPASTGLGSSAAAILSGLLGANDLLGRPFDEDTILRLGTALEGHPDNIAPALFGGLVISAQTKTGIITRPVPVPDLELVVVTPDVHWPTRTARAVLPKSVPFADAVFNLGRTALVVEALRSGDLDLLRASMDDRLHQPYRLSHIPGAVAAQTSARERGAAVAISGAGPSLVAFAAEDALENITAAMLQAFDEAGVSARARRLRLSNAGSKKL